MPVRSERATPSELRTCAELWHAPERERIPRSREIRIASPCSTGHELAQDRPRRATRNRVTCRRGQSATQSGATQSGIGPERAHPAERRRTAPAPSDAVNRTHVVRRGQSAPDSARLRRSALSPSGPAPPKRTQPVRPGSAKASPTGSAAAGAAATAAALGRGRGSAGPAAGDRDGGEQLDRVVVALRTGGGRGRLAHRAADLERVATGAAPELVTRHWHRVGPGPDRKTRGGPTQP